MVEPFTKIDGPVKFPGFSGKQHKRSRFLSGEQRVYWVPTQPVMTRFSATYQAPTNWPRTNAPVVMPRMVFWLYDPAAVGWSATGNAVKTQIEATYHDVHVTVQSIFTNVLGFCAPRTEDAASGLYLATDVLFLLFPGEEGSPEYWNAVYTPGIPPFVVFPKVCTIFPQPTTFYLNDRAAIAAIVNHFPRYAIEIFPLNWFADHAARVLLQGTDSANCHYPQFTRFWYSTFSGAGINATVHPEQSFAGGDPATFIQLIENHFGLT